MFKFKKKYSLKFSEAFISLVVFSKIVSCCFVQATTDSLGRNLPPNKPNKFVASSLKFKGLPVANNAYREKSIGFKFIEKEKIDLGSLKSKINYNLAEILIIRTLNNYIVNELKIENNDCGASKFPTNSAAYTDFKYWLNIFQGGYDLDLSKEQSFENQPVYVRRKYGDVFISNCNLILNNEKLKNSNISENESLKKGKRKTYDENYNILKLFGENNCTYINDYDYDDTFEVEPYKPLEVEPYKPYNKGYQKKDENEYEEQKEKAQDFREEFSDALIKKAIKNVTKDNVKLILEEVIGKISGTYEMKKKANWSVAYFEDYKKVLDSLKKYLSGFNGNNESEVKKNLEEIKGILAKIELKGLFMNSNNFLPPCI